MHEKNCKQRLRRAVRALWGVLALWPAAAAAQGTGLDPAGFNSPLGAFPGAGLFWSSSGLLYGTTRAGGSNGAGSLFNLSPDGTGFDLLYSFGGGADGSNPDAALVQSWYGGWYGTTTYGGLGCGVVFNLSDDGTTYTVLYTFTGRDGDGAYPVASLVQGWDTAFYGACYSGGTAGAGTLFKLNLDGSGYTVLHRFNVQDGALPRAPLYSGWDGVLYGTTTAGGSNEIGTVFRMERDGSGYTVLHHFLADGVDGAYPFSALVQGTDGALYGTTTSGGENHAGIIFKLNTDGSGYQILHSFAQDGVDGTCPYSPLVSGWDWALYGTTLHGGSNNAGTVFKLNTDGTGYQILHSFAEDGTDGAYPSSPLIQGLDWGLYGTTLEGGSDGVGTVFGLNLDGSDYGVRHSFVAEGTAKANVLTTPPPRLVSVTILPDKNCQVTLAGATNLVWRVEAASSLAGPAAWESLGPVTVSNGLMQFTDLNATNYPQRYYRAVWP